LLFAVGQGAPEYKKSKGKISREKKGKKFRQRKGTDLRGELAGRKSWNFGLQLANSNIQKGGGEKRKVRRKSNKSRTENQGRKPVKEKKTF